MSEHATPVGGKMMTPTARILLLLAIVGGALTIWRFAVGLGPSTGLSDGYPWGIWIAFDVVTGTALACGGYAIALLVYVFNKGRYHPLVRPALLTSALGYSIAAIAIVIDVGRPWFIHRIPLSPGKWNLDSALLEVALCVMAYVIVLWIELSPAFLERWKDGSAGWLAALSRRMLPVLDRVLLVFIALGILLPTMHQSSLGTVMMLAGPRLHPLWHTAWLPLLFLLSCIAMGYGVVVLESSLSTHYFRRRQETKMLGSLSGVMIFVLLVYVALRLVDLVLEGRTGLFFSSGAYSVMFWLEIALFMGPAFLLMDKGRRSDPSHLFRAAMLILLAGTLYRFDAYLVAFRPSPGWSYFPSLPEILITVGLVSFEILAYLLLVKSFPILSGAVPAVAKR